LHAWAEGRQRRREVASPRYVFIGLRCVTILRSRGQFSVAIWEHARVDKIKNSIAAIDVLGFICRGKTMTSDRKTWNDPDSNFSYGVREIREATAARELSVADAPLKASTEKLGSDPYNTSGSFDRKKNWARVGKR
jgi:hypothetical protein